MDAILKLIERWLAICSMRRMRLRDGDFVICRTEHDFRFAETFARVFDELDLRHCHVVFDPEGDVKVYDEKMMAAIGWVRAAPSTPALQVVEP